MLLLVVCWLNKYQEIVQILYRPIDLLKEHEPWEVLSRFLSSGHKYYKWFCVLILRRLTKSAWVEE
jgi:hypothetical protein